MPGLFDRLRIGEIELRNRIVMAPMTRSRADGRGVPSDMTPTYYAQRASAGLIITEGTAPSAMGMGYIRTPGIYTDEQVRAWRAVTEAVHGAGGRIALQLMHCGRISHPSLLPGGATPVAPSAVQPRGGTYTDEGMKPHVMPRALEQAEISATVEEFRHATARAFEAGFDSVDLHGGAGYLPMQFLSSSTNHREDEYGGSVERRARFILEVLDAMASVRGAHRIGINLSPEMTFNDISDDTPIETYTYLVKAIGTMGLAYLHVSPYGSQDYHALLRPLFKGPYLAGGGFDQAKGEAFLNEGRAEAIVYGSMFIANPDLPERFRCGAPLAKADQATFYTGGAKGYIDYPLLDGER